jgi:NAD(P)-dependent dehydrogenase (short-subunit alcohol dehydrogenase family)
MTSNADNSHTVLVTGTSSGIGRATALLLDQSGFRVFATVRKETDAKDLQAEASARLRPLIMDVTNEAQIADAFAEVQRELGEKQGLFALVNNAGSAEGGPLEIMSMTRMRRQFNTNVFGPMMVTQTFLPLLHQSKGRIINVISAVAECPMPFLGSYAGTKCALLGMSMSLRRELKWFGLTVSAILPGFIKTKGWDEVDRTMANVEQEDVNDRYFPLMKDLLDLALPPAENGAPPDIVAKTILKILRAKNPKAVYRCGPGAGISRYGNMLPENLVHWVQERHVRKKREAEARRTVSSTPTTPSGLSKSQEPSLEEVKAR